MEIRIIFDSNAVENGYRTGWGVSYLIDGKILFDAGGKDNDLLVNMEKMGIEPADISFVVISHGHWDHTDGLWAVLKKNPDVTLYLCPSFDEGFKQRITSFGSRIVENSGFAEIEKNIYVTGEVGGRYALKYLGEQSLILKTERGITVITGCAHPGIIHIVSRVKRKFAEDIHLAVGGFHLKDHKPDLAGHIVSELWHLGVKNVGPTHCTGEEARGMFREKYGNKFVDVKVGGTIKV